MSKNSEYFKDMPKMPQMHVLVFLHHIIFTSVFKGTATDTGIVRYVASRPTTIIKYKYNYLRHKYRPMILSVY